jgi:tetratricopeptide (TPR) repeat protein
MLGWLLGLGLAAVVVQAFTSVLSVQWLPRFELRTTAGEVVFAVTGLFLEFFWWLLALKIAVEGLRAAASGREQQAGRENRVDDPQALRQLLLWCTVLLAGYSIYLELGGIALSFYGALMVLLLPAILGILGMEDSLQHALDPVGWSQLFRTSGVDYLLTVAKLVALVLLTAFLQLKFVPQGPPWLHAALSRMLLLFAMFAGYRELGLLFDRHLRRLGAAAGPISAAELTPEELLAVRAAERFGIDQRFARGARELASLASSPGASAPLHAMYRKLLLLAGDEAGLQEHASTYVPELLALGQEAEALALYRDSHSVDPGFEVTDARALTQLLELALREHDVSLAIELAQEFLRRFPDEPDAVPNGLTAARLLDRQGADEDARQIIVGLVRRFPQHPLRGELVAALETLEGVARRSS